MLILDEATANLDPAAEGDVILGYESVMRGRTTIVVSHRLELVRRAGRVVVLGDGRIVEEGMPEELRRSSREFCRLFGLQRREPIRVPTGLGGPGA